ncbi:MAG: DUF2807 domain-containing protein [Litorimonas sp.]
MFRPLLLGIATSAVIASPGFAADVTIRNFIGQIIITPGSDGVEVLDRGRKGEVDYSESGSAILIDGGQNLKQLNEVCNGRGGLSFDLEWSGMSYRGDTRLKDYPQLRVSVPNGSTLTVEDSAMRLDADLVLGDVDLDVSGCFDMKFSDMTSLDLQKSGSGDLEIGKVDRLSGKKSGAGDVDIESVGAFRLNQSGAGDIEIGTVTRSFEIEKSGAGDIEIDRADGTLDVRKSGAGDVEVADGRLTEVILRNSGAGDVDIDADIVDADVRASGAGDVYLKSVSGVLSQEVSGAADLRRGDD